MTMYRATFNTHIEVTVEVEADDEDYAVDGAWELAEEFLQTLGTRPGVGIKHVEASLDGIGADTVEEIP